MASSANTLPYRTFRLSSTQRKKVETAFGGRIKRVALSPLAPAGGCYWNADEHAQRLRGTVVHGWLVLEWPKKLVIGMHHAVVRLPDRSLVDVTALPFGDQAQVPFIEDNSIIPPRDYPVFIPNKSLKLCETEGVNLLVQSSERQLAIKREIVEMCRNAGVPFDVARPVEDQAPVTKHSEQLVTELRSTMHDVDRAHSLMLRGE